MKKRLQHKNHTSLQIELSNGTLCTMVKIMDLPLCPRYWHFQANKYISNVSVEGIMQPKLIVNWEGLKITNQISNNSMSPPETIPLNWIQAFIAYQVIKQSFCAFSVLQHHKQAFHFLICPLDCNTCSAPTNNQTAKIYPTVPNNP